MTTNCDKSEWFLLNLSVPTELDSYADEEVASMMMAS